MRPVSAAFLRTLTGSHTMAARARICSAFQTGTNPTGTFVDFDSGSVQADSTASIRSTLDMEIVGTPWPSHASDLLAPYGNEVFVERGLQYGNGTTEWVSLGYFRINNPDQGKPPDGPIRITAADRMSSIIDSKLIYPVQFQANQTYGTVVTQLVQQVYPAASIEWDDTTSTQTLGRQVVATSDRFKFVNDMVTALGKIWYWDHRGVLVIKTPPSPANPVWTVAAGKDGVLVAGSRQLSRANVYNAVVASGEAADTNAPVMAVAYNNDPGSPTYYYGPFGPIPQFYSSPFITTVSQAQAAGASILQQQLGLPYVVSFNAVPNPALEPLDPVSIRFSDREAAETHVLKQVTIPLQAKDNMAATTRDQTIVLIGHL